MQIDSLLDVLLFLCQFFSFQNTCLKFNASVSVPLTEEIATSVQGVGGRLEDAGQIITLVVNELSLAMSFRVRGRVLKFKKTQLPS